MSPSSRRAAVGWHGIGQRTVPSGGVARRVRCEAKRKPPFMAITASEGWMSKGRKWLAWTASNIRRRPIAAGAIDSGCLRLRLQCSVTDTALCGHAVGVRLRVHPSAPASTPGKRIQSASTGRGQPRSSGLALWRWLTSSRHDSRPDSSLSNALSFTCSAARLRTARERLRRHSRQCRPHRPGSARIAR